MLSSFIQPNAHLRTRRIRTCRETSTPTHPQAGRGGEGERLHDSEHQFTCQRDGTREEKEWAVFLSPSIEDPGAFSQSLRDLINLHSFYITHSLITYL